MMKRAIYILLFCILTHPGLSAQIRAGYSFNAIGNEWMPALQSNWGANIAAEKTFFLNKGDIIRLGIDATWMDLNYAFYKIIYNTGNTPELYSCHQSAISVGLGLSLWLFPSSDFKIRGYGGFAPTYSYLYAQNTLYGGYASIYKGGISFIYKSIGIDLQGNKGICDYTVYKTISPSKNSDDAPDMKGTDFMELRCGLLFYF